ncbi:MAG: hypothetical protein KDN19_10465 [Verrucomicrobiae bacterium]|nr:hypothetical protein [Verrucomicrobiae bacterium]
MTQLLIVLGVIVLAMALRSFGHPVVRKAGAVAILVATYLAGWFATASHVAGVAAVLMWFLLPWIELLTRIRKLRLPMRKSLHHQSPPNARRFPNLGDFTDEIEKEGFEYAEDAGWEWDELKQFFRIFYSEEAKTQAAICLNEQQGMAFVFVSLTSRAEDGRIFRTWNFPFSYTLKMAPEIQVNRVPNAESFAALLKHHREFIERSGVAFENLIDENPEALPELMETETHQQIRHNLDRGLIEECDQEPDRVRYSWRGLFYLYGQLVKDMVKLS